MLLYWAGMNSCTEGGCAAPGTNNGDLGEKRCGDRIWGGGVGCKWIEEQLFMEEYFRFSKFVVGQLRMWKKGTQEVVTGRDPVEPAKKDFTLKNEVGEMLNCRAPEDREFWEKFPSHLERDGGSLLCGRKLCALAECSDTRAPCWSWCVRTCGRGLTLGTAGWWRGG